MGEGLDDALWVLAQDARWFAGRSRGGSPAGVTLGDWLVHPTTHTGIRSAVLDVTFRGGDRERYHVPLVYRPTSEAVAPEIASTSIAGQAFSIGELCDDPDAAGMLLALLRKDAPGFQRWGDVPTGLSGRRFTGEQSNTSLFFGDKVMCKVFRRLEDGPNVDVELHRALAGTGAVAEIHGAWSVGDTDLAIFTESLKDPQDGYDLAVDSARSGTSFAAEARALGSTLAQVHVTLAERLPTGATEGAALAATFSQRFEAAAVEAPEIEPFREAIRGTWQALPESLATQRIHGDCHLGQVLLSRGQWRYVDFEGEPLKTLAERREPDSRWRDVAGMLRSFDYAAAAGAASTNWLAECRTTFLEGYGVPGPEEEGLLAAFEADKAIYEVIYERRNRPHLIHVPIDSLNRLARRNTMTHDQFGGLTGTELQGFHQGGDTELWKRLGSFLATVDGDDGPVTGVRFAVWAPNAHRVQVTGDFNGWEADELALIPGTGVWGGFIPGIGEDALYKFRVQGADGSWREKVDPMARFSEQAPTNASIVYESKYVWSDDEWIARREKSRAHAEPMSVYELHLGGWRPGKSYLDLADELVEYVTWQGYTHVELMPVAEHPFAPSWGYQVTGYFAPTSRFGKPDDFRYLVDRLHQAGIGVILDWVPGHFPKDEWALGRFDGTALYEHADPRQGEHRDWGTYIFNYGRNEVKSFLVSNALYWINEFHIDGLRVDAVASMLYLDYSREEGEWVPNEFGGRENLEAIDFLRYVNKHLYERHPGVLMIAEESTSFPGVTKGVHEGGLGFGFKWNMGWMNDSLRYLELDPVYRQYEHNLITFAMVYAYSENFILPISHDEVVHGKGSMMEKVPQDDWRKFATLRAFYSFMWSFPGKQLIFMGSEFGSRPEFSESTGLEWWVSDLWGHRGLQQLFRDLNALYRDNAPLYELDSSPEGFTWIRGDDAARNTLSWVRHDEAGNHVACITNFSPEPLTDMSVGLPEAGVWEEILNTDSAVYDGADEFGNLGQVTAREQPWGHFPAQANVTVPPLGSVWLRRQAATDAS